MDEAAKSDSSGTRAAVAQALAGRADATSVALLNTLSQDEDNSVQSAAIYAMGSIGSRESTDRLIEMAREPSSEVRTVALSVIGNSGDTRASDVIAEAITSGDADLARSAIGAAYNAGPAVDQPLRTVLNDEDAATHLRQQAASALVGRGGEVDAELLEALQPGLLEDHHIGDYRYSNW